MNISVSKHTLANGLERPAARGSHLSDCRREPVVSRRIEERAAGTHGFRASVRASDVRRIRASRQGILRAAAGGGRRAERIDQRRPHELLGSRAVQRARSRPLDGIGSPRVSVAGADRGEILEPARRRAQRAQPELRKPSLRPGADGGAGGAVSAGSSVPLDDDRRGGRPPRSQARGRAGVLPRLLPPRQRLAGARRRHRSPRLAWRWPARISRTSRRVRRWPRCGPSRRRSRRSAGSCSRIASSFRGCPSRG